VCSITTIKSGIKIELYTKDWLIAWHGVWTMITLSLLDCDFIVKQSVKLDFLMVVDIVKT
jgi:hypothetical protein